MTTFQGHNSLQTDHDSGETVRDNRTWILSQSVRDLSINCTFSDSMN